MQSLIEKLTTQALSAFNGSNFLVAKKILKEALRMRPKDPELLLLLGVTEAQLNNYERAVDLLLKADIYKSNNSSIWNSLGVCYARLNLFEKSSEAFKKALGLEPASHEAHLNYAQLLFANKEFNSARSLLERSIILNPYDANSYFKLANVLFEMGEKELSKTFYFKTLDLQPNHELSRNFIQNLDFDSSGNTNP